MKKYYWDKCYMITRQQQHPAPLHITLGNEQCLKLLLGVCNTKKEERSLHISDHALLYLPVMGESQMRAVCSPYPSSTWRSTAL
jgi:hypothetical protein